MYIEADEDHVSLQFCEKKGNLDVEKESVLQFIYMGIVDDIKENKRNRSRKHRLVLNTHKLLINA